MEIRSSALPQQVQHSHSCCPVNVDRLKSAATDQAPTGTGVGTMVPTFSSTLAGVDNYGFIADVDGVTRTRDALGNTTQVQTSHGLLDLQYDGLSRLRKVTRPDGTVIDYEYRSDGPLSYRKVTCSATAMDCADAERVYVYDGLLLLEEFEIGAGQRDLMARYFYADEGDIPLGADLRDPMTGQVKRHYFITYRMGSITGVMDENGTIEERVNYDPYGKQTVMPSES